MISAFGVVHKAVGKPMKIFMSSNGTRANGTRSAGYGVQITSGSRAAKNQRKAHYLRPYDKLQTGGGKQVGNALDLRDVPTSRQSRRGLGNRQGG